MMFQLIRTSVYRSSALTLLILAALACGGSPSTPAPLASVADTPTAIPVTSTPAVPVESVGTSAQNPYSRDETVMTANWEFKVIEVHWGEDAMTMLGEASAF